jgi:hypothetical protein
VTVQVWEYRARSCSTNQKSMVCSDMTGEKTERIFLERRKLLSLISLYNVILLGGRTKTRSITLKYILDT